MSIGDLYMLLRELPGRRSGGADASIERLYTTLVEHGVDSRDALELVRDACHATLDGVLDERDW